MEGIQRTTNRNNTFLIYNFSLKIINNAVLLIIVKDACRGSLL